MDQVLPLARLTVTDPRAAARTLLDYGFPREHHWTLFLLVVSLGGAVFAAANVMAPPPEDAPALSGLMAAVLVGGSIFVSTGVMLLAGRLFGARAEAPDAMLLVLWLELLSLAVQILVLIVGFVAPGAGMVLALIYFLLFVWLLSAFTAELHGFATVLRGFVGLAVATLALAFGVALLQAVLMAVIS